MKAPYSFAGLAVSLLLFSVTSRADPMVFTTMLSGGAESPSNASPGTGHATITYDSGAHTLEVNVTFSGLLGTTTASHIHAATAVAFAGTAGIATQLPTFNGFPLGVTAGSYDNTFDLTQALSFNPAYVTAWGSVANAEAALITAMLEGKAYLNIHTTAFPGGEMRGFLSPVPDSSATIVLLLPALAAALGFARFRIKSSA